MQRFDWIRTMRKKQGLKGFQLAERMQVSAARISALEKGEEKGGVTLKMMQRAAAALGCRFEYRLVRLSDDSDGVEQPGKPRYRVV